MIAGLLATTMVLSGCNEQRVDEPTRKESLDATRSAALDARPPEISAAEKAKAGSGGATRHDAVPADHNDLPPRPSITSNSPIDALPEGARYRAALAAIDHGRIDIAENIRNELAQHPTYSVLADAIHTVLLARDGQFDAAMKSAQQVSTVAVMQPEAFMIAGDVFRYHGRWGSAIACLKSAVSANPGLARAHRWLGILNYDIGAMHQATEHLRMAADIDATDIGSLQLSARIYSEYRNFSDAAVDCRRALERDPAEPVASELRLRLADALRELRKFDAALQALEKCPDTSATWASRAQILEAQGSSEQALAACKLALEHQDDNRTASLVSGRIYLAMREPERAVEPLRHAVAGDPIDHESRFLLGRALLLAGQPEQGKAEIQRSTELKENFQKIAQLHFEAVDRPLDVAVRLQLAKLTEQSGRPDVAAMWFRAVLGLEPDNLEAKKGLQRLAAAGDFAK